MTKAMCTNLAIQNLVGKVHFMQLIAFVGRPHQSLLIAHCLLPKAHCPRRQLPIGLYSCLPLNS
ncbi:hypothetical protein [Leptolyngbya sp. Heron Island J]|uniref:hypothetical protein n=1 Tax=Leptolyngbya sp. Heron Island J TaxID=1385935 RepID=UPI0004006A4A|nr:hypothetical protein [Leptolyngbya sp. Heron Island J]